MDDLGIKRYRSMAYHPHIDRKIELINQKAEQYLRCYSNENQVNWAYLLPTLQFYYNSSSHSSKIMFLFKENYSLTLAGTLY